VFGFGWIPEGAVILDIYGLFLSFSLHQSFQDLCRMMRQQPNHTSNSVTANKSTTDGSSIGANLKVTAPVPTTVRMNVRRESFDVFFFFKKPEDRFHCV